MPGATEFRTGEKRNPVGRPKGRLNKTTVAAKDAIALAAEGLGGTDRLIAWAQEDPLNERTFWGTIYPKLLPLQVSGAVNLTFQKVERAIIDAAQDAQD